ncbi:MAG: RsmE family RNA methyltransferase [Chloroflexota bacterium]
MHRFFIPSSWIEKKIVKLVDDVAHQLKNVLRMEPGRKIIVLDGSGYEHFVSLTQVTKKLVVGEIYDSRPVQGEPDLKLTLYQGTLKAQKFEWVLQKGTELGISTFVPVIGERSVLSDVESVDKKMARWGRIVQEAAEQSGRGILPKVRPAMIFSQACQQAGQAGGLAVLGWENEDKTDLKSALTQVQDVPQSVSLFIGSEGGFTLDEVRLASGYQIAPVGLGKRILRAETAGLIAGAAIFYHFDQLA